jgi:hypothetical protein
MLSVSIIILNRGSVENLFEFVKKCMPKKTHFQRMMRICGMLVLKYGENRVSLSLPCCQ